jgi:hypothetical protein
VFILCVLGMLDNQQTKKEPIMAKKNAAVEVIETETTTEENTGGQWFHEILFDALRTGKRDLLEILGIYWFVAGAYWLHVHPRHFQKVLSIWALEGVPNDINPMLALEKMKRLAAAALFYSFKDDIFGHVEHKFGIKLSLFGESFPEVLASFDDAMNRVIEEVKKQGRTTAKAQIFSCPLFTIRLDANTNKVMFQMRNGMWKEQYNRSKSRDLNAVVDYYVAERVENMLTPTYSRSEEYNNQD